MTEDIQNKENNLIDMGLPSTSPAIIKVIGVGGGGGNAVNHMYREGIHDVNFVLCNTDSKALCDSPVPMRLQSTVQNVLVQLLKRAWKTYAACSTMAPRWYSSPLVWVAVQVPALLLLWLKSLKKWVS